MISLIALYCIIRIMRSEAFARRFGALTGRIVRWSYGLARRKPSDEDFVAATLRFREGIAQTWHERGMRVSAAVVGNYVVQGMIFGLSIRAVGLDSSEVPLGAIAVVYTVVRLLTIVNFTPGGVGVTEALYTTALLTVTDGADKSQIVAAVFLFRGLTYIGPILLGAVCLLIWRFRSSWRVHRPEPVAEAAVGAVLADREPPTAVALLHRVDRVAQEDADDEVDDGSEERQHHHHGGPDHLGRRRQLLPVPQVEQAGDDDREPQDREDEQEDPHHRTVRGRPCPCRRPIAALPMPPLPRWWLRDARSLGYAGRWRKRGRRRVRVASVIP